MVKRSFFSKLVSERGQELVEYAIALPIFAFIVIGIFDLGRVVYYYSAMQNSAREGARYGVVNPHTNGIPDLVKTRSIGVHQSNLSVSVLWNCEVVNVDVDYDFQLVTPLIGRLFPPDGEVNISTGSELQRERFDLDGDDSHCFTEDPPP